MRIVATTSDDWGVGDQDRNAILARRALFISAALAGIGCTTHTSSSEPERGAESGEPPKVVVEPPTTDGKRPTDGTRPSWAEIMAAAPPLDVPKGLTERDAELLTYLAEGERRRYEELGKIWDALPDCSPSAADCVAWSKAIETIAEVTDFFGPLCGYSPEMTNTYVERLRAHREYVQSISDMLLADLDAAVDQLASATDSDAWRNQRARLLEEPPRPCLSCAAPKAASITDAIPFAVGEAALSQSAEIKDVLQSVQRTNESNRISKAKLIVRGHASASESNPESLARKRAEAVVDALVALGAERRHIEVRSYADLLPISNDPGKAELNCRVDFEVVVP